MNTTYGARLRQSAQRLEIPDAPLSMVAIQSVEAACHKDLQRRGMTHKLTSSYSGRPVKKAARVIRRAKQRNAVLNQALSQRDPIAMGRLYL
jgi:hypothetical protein